MKSNKGLFALFILTCICFGLLASTEVEAANKWRQQRHRIGPKTPVSKNDSTLLAQQIADFLAKHNKFHMLRHHQAAYARKLVKAAHATASAICASSRTQICHKLEEESKQLAEFLRLHSPKQVIENNRKSGPKSRNKWKRRSKKSYWNRLYQHNVHNHNRNKLYTFSSDFAVGVVLLSKLFPFNLFF